MKLGKVVDVKVVDTVANTEVTYKASTTPMKATVGHHLFGTLKYTGMKKLQDAGINVTCEKEYVEVIRQMFAKFGANLLPEDFGRGALWRDETAKARWKVYVDGEEFTSPVKEYAKKSVMTDMSGLLPEAVNSLGSLELQAVPNTIPPLNLSAKSLNVLGESESEGLELPELVPEPPKPQVPTLSVTDRKNLDKIKVYLNKGISENRIVQALTEKYGEAKSKILLRLAKQ